MDRVELMLNGISKKQSGLEIGPSIRPLVRKKDGYNVKIIDHMSAEDLKEKYKDHGVNLAEIENVDFIFNGEKYSDLVNGEKFDYILASHLIEHVPDLVGFLQDCDDVLKPFGEIRLAIPDKRFCFDIDRECSSLSRVLDVHEQGFKTQTIGAVAEYFLKVCKKNGQIAWDINTIGNVEKVHTLIEAQNAIFQTRQGKYLDIHNWVFTLDSFVKIIDDLNKLGYTSLTTTYKADTIGHEFFAFLAKIPSS